MSCTHPEQAPETIGIINMFRNTKKTYIDTGPEEALLGEFDGDASSDLFDFVVGVFSRIDLYATFSATKRYIDDCAFVGH